MRNPGFPLVHSNQPEHEGGLFLRLDDPEHARLRQMVRPVHQVTGRELGFALWTSTFGRHDVQELTTFVDRTVDSLLRDAQR